jgi:hypothetical protein
MIPLEREACIFMLAGVASGDMAQTCPRNFLVDIALETDNARKPGTDETFTCIWRPALE